MMDDGPNQPYPDRHAVAIACNRAVWVRNFGNALVVGGGGVVLTLLLGGMDLQQQPYVALDVLYGALLVACSIFSWLSLNALGERPSNSMLANALIPGVGILAAATWAALANSPWPMKAYTGNWWSLIAVALLATIIGLRQRQAADNLLKTLESQASR